MSKKTQKARAQAKRRQKNAAKAQKRAKNRTHKPRPTQSGPQVTKAQFPEVDRAFWMAHGVNFLASNYGEGEWSPMYPEIYEDGWTPDEAVLADRLSALADDEENMTPQQRAVLGFALHDPQTHYIFKLQAEKLIKAAGDETPEATARLPHQPLVWQMFHDEILVKAMSRAKKV
tara:strand:+ start:1972 stop:2493 length:522 start_codon:yes stop_codon:yes gene_type:complete